MRSELCLPAASLLAVWLAGSASCSRKTPPPQPARTAVLRFDNLTGDAALDWVGRGVARQLASQLRAVPRDGADVSAERTAALTSGVGRLIHGYVFRAGARLVLRAFVEQSPSSFRAEEASGDAGGGVASLAAAMARRINPSSQPLYSPNDAALAAFAAGLDSRDTAQAAAAFEKAVGLDPSFGPSYVAWIELALRRQDRAEAARILAIARQRAASLEPRDRLRLELEAAFVSGDRAAYVKSLSAIVELDPSDPDLLRRLGAEEQLLKHFPRAIAHYRQALALSSDPGLLNEIAYAQSWAGDFAGAVETLRQYERLRPDDPNVYDSAGEIHFVFGKFKEAEGFYRRAYEKNPGFLRGATLAKAAFARLMTGDINGAAQIKEERLRTLPPVEAAFRRAEWLHYAGKREEARRQMETVARSGSSASKSFAHIQLAVWFLQAGDRVRAGEQARLAAASAAMPANAAYAGVCTFLAMPSATPDEWTRRADVYFAKAIPLKNLALAYAFLLDGHFGAAEPLLRVLESSARPNAPETAPVLLAWALVGSGRADEAAPLIERTPVWEVVSPAPFQAMALPRIFELRAKVAEKKGDRTGAERNRKLFEALSGR
ncbi:MAG: hypothetical protein ACRD8O_11105 [Bryobacteraceae bacterium]